MDTNTTLIDLPGMQIMRPTACVLLIRYDDNLNVTLDMAKQLTHQVARHFRNTELAVVHSAGSSTTIEPGVREYLASTSRYAHKVSEAFVVKNLGQRILANFYLRIARPACPTEVFTTEDEAVNWVKMYCRNKKEDIGTEDCSAPISLSA